MRHLTAWQQRGLSLVELMVGMLVSLVVLAAVGGMYLTTVRGQTYALRTAKLNQELRATMNVITADLRRAGYWGGAVSGGTSSVLSADPGGGRSYPYSRRGASGSQTDLTVLDGGGCILYAYDANNDGIDPVPAGEVFGFRLNGNAVEMLNGGVTVTSSCSADTWLAVTSADIVTISGLSFSTTGSQCLNVTKGLSWRLTQSPSTQPACAATGEATYVAPTSGDMLIETRQIFVTLSGAHAADPTMTATVSETVYVQNDRVFIAP